MMPDPITVAPDTPFLQVQHLFLEAGISGAPVVDGQGTVIGVVSTSDLLRAVDQACDDDIDPAPAEGHGDVALAERLAELTARDLATPEVVWVSPDASIADVARRMRGEGIHRVLVGLEGRLIGILTPFDLLREVCDLAR